MSTYDPNDPTRPTMPTTPPPSYDPPTVPVGGVGGVGGSHVADGSADYRGDSGSRSGDGHWMDKVNHFMPLAMAALLALILLAQIIDIVADEEERDENRDGLCIQYSYDDDGQMTFSEMTPLQRAIADNYDCDVEGR